jgi:hypothetical protein
VSYLPASASSFQCISLLAPCHRKIRNAYISQAAKDAQASQDTLIDIFGRIEMFSTSRNPYRIAVDQEMMDTIVQIIVEILSVIGIATKEIEQGRTSK